MSKERLLKAILNTTSIVRLEKLKNTGLDMLIARNDITSGDKSEIIIAIDAKIAELSA